MEPASTATVGPRLDRLPVTRLHWLVFAAVLAGLCIDTYDLFLGGGVLGALVAIGWSTLETNAYFQSATFAGLAIGALSAGFIADHLGRRRAFRINLLIFGAASLAAAAAPSMNWLILCRFIIGLGLGAEIVVSYSILTEFAPPQVRARWIAIGAILTAAMLVVASFSVYRIVPAFGWRPMFLIPGVLAFGVWVFRGALPESPRWLEARGRAAEADLIVRRFEAAAGTPVAALSPVEPGRSAASPSLAVLFRKRMLAGTICVLLLNVVCQIGYYGFIGWVPTFLVKEGHSLSSSLGYVALMSVGQPLGSAICFLVGDRIGRKPSLIAGCLFLGILGSLYLFKPTLHEEVLLGFFILAAMSFVLSLGQLIYTPEMFPTALRTRGMGLANAGGRLAGIVSPYGVVALYTSSGLVGVLATIAALFALLAGVVALLGTETTGQTLEAVAALRDPDKIIA